MLYGNSVDPYQLASSEASRSSSTLFLIEFIWFHTIFKELMHGISKVRDRLSSLCNICSLANWEK